MFEVRVCKSKVLSLPLSLAVTIFMVVAPSPRLAEAKTTPQTGNSGVEDELRLKEGDENGNEVKELKTELIVIHSEKKALEQLKKLQRQYDGTPMESEILFRFAELYMRRARSERFFEVHRTSDQVMTFVPTLVKQASEATEIRKAITIYEKITNKFPDFRSMDVVLFNSAYAEEQIGENAAAQKFFAKLIKEYPDSNLVPDSYLSLGELSYQDRKFAVALENFKAIRQFPDAHVYPYGLYKAAWSYYNLQDATSGIKQLEDVIKFGRQVMAKQLDSKLDLRKEALNDLALFYSDVMPANKAVAYFKEQSAEVDSTPYIFRLTELYKRHSRYADTEIVLNDVLAQIKDRTAIALAHDELVWNYDRTKSLDKAVTQLATFDKFCSTPPVKGAPVDTNCGEKLSDTAKKLASKWHGIWEKILAQVGDQRNEISPDKTMEMYASTSEKAYRVYLKNASLKDKDLPAIRFAFAELLYARAKSPAQFREASENYASIEGYQKNGLVVEKKVARDSSYAAIVSLEKAVSNKWNGPTGDADEKRFVELSESYVQRFPDAQYVLDLKFKRAFIAYEKEHYDEAAPLFKKLGWMTPTSAEKAADKGVAEKITKAQDLYLDILNQKKDYKSLREAAQSLMDHPSADGVRGGQIEKIYREAYFAEIQQMEEKGDIKGAIVAYKKFAVENKASDLGAKAWWNASLLQFKIGEAMAGANTCAEMHTLFPKSANESDCLIKATQTYESIARLDLAANVLMTLAQVDTDKQIKWQELAADFFALSGQKEKATALYLKLSDGNVKPETRVGLLEKAAHLASETGDMKTLSHIESLYVQMGVEPQTSRLVVEQAENALKQNDLTKAFNLSKKIIGRDSLPKDLLARARFVQAQVLEDEYRHQSVKASQVQRIGTVLALKTERLEKAQKAYQSAILYGDAHVSVLALHKLADCYLNYSKTIREMVLPGEVSEADRQAFKGEIDQISIPMEEKGIEAMNQALETARKAQFHDGQVAELQNELNKLNMKATTTVAVKVATPSVYLPIFRAPASKEVHL
jgi:cellulose synthase operon protein C